MKNQAKIDSKFKQARQAEKDGDLKTAEKQYQKLIKSYPEAFSAYDRLMIIYRKAKEAQKELHIINLGIQNYKSHYLEKQQAWIKKNEAAAGLTRELAISLGLMDKEGYPVSADPQLAKWLRRKDLLMERSKKKAKPKKVPGSSVRKKQPQLNTISSTHSKMKAKRQV